MGATGRKNLSVFAFCIQGIYDLTRDAWSLHTETPRFISTGSHFFLHAIIHKVLELTDELR